MGRFTIPILSNFLEQIGDGVVNALLKLVWSLIKGLMFILDGLQEAFFFITGVEKMKINFNGDEIGITLLEMMFGITLNWSEDGKLEYHNLDFSVPLHKTYFAMLGVFAVVFVFPAKATPGSPINNQLDISEASALIAVTKGPSFLPPR